MFLALVGAFETDAAPIVSRLVYWVGLCLVGALLAAIASAWIGRVGAVKARPCLFGALVALAVTPPITVLVWLIGQLRFHGSMGPRLLTVYLPPVLIIAMAVRSVNALAQAKHLEARTLTRGAAPRLLDRLSPGLRDAEVFAVEAEDHYLRLHTSLGQHLILMRFRDALTELDTIEGAQTHRSWWVAKSAVQGAQRRDGRATLEIKGGSRAPVSRAYARALRKAGWY